MKSEDLYQLHEKETTEARVRKISTLGRLLSILLDCISKGIDDMKVEQAELRSYIVM
jgi:hypothetical protein